MLKLIDPLVQWSEANLLATFATGEVERPKKMMTLIRSPWVLPPALNAGELLSALADRNNSGSRTPRPIPVVWQIEKVQISAKLPVA